VTAWRYLTAAVDGCALRACEALKSGRRLFIKSLTWRTKFAAVPVTPFRCGTL
jgi:hypothetical protein